MCACVYIYIANFHLLEILHNMIYFIEATLTANTGFCSIICTIF